MSNDSFDHEISLQWIDRGHYFIEIKTNANPDELNYASCMVQNIWPSDQPYRIPVLLWNQRTSPEKKGNETVFRFLIDLAFSGSLRLVVNTKDNRPHCEIKKLRLF